MRFNPEQLERLLAHQRESMVELSTKLEALCNRLDKIFLVLAATGFLGVVLGGDGLETLLKSDIPAQANATASVHDWHHAYYERLD